MTADAHALIGAYVLDAVDDLERASFERHLRDCEVCRGEVDELRESAARLADGAWSVPPPSLRANVMAAIGTTRQLPPPAPVAPVAAPRDRSRRRLVAVAAAAVVLAAGGVFAVQEQRVRDERATAESALAGEARVRAVLAAPDLRVREQTLTGGGRVTVAMSRTENAGVIILAADAAPPGDRVYQLWTIRAQVPVSEGPLEPGQTAKVQIVEGMDQASDVGVTVEPPGGSRAPTTPLVADVKLA